MREKQESGSVPVPAEFASMQSATVDLCDKDLLATIRSLAAHGLRQPLYSARCLVAFGGQLSKVPLGGTLHQPDPQDTRFRDPSWRLNPFYRRTLQACPTWRRQLLAWIGESNLDYNDRARARFLAALFSDATAPSNSLINLLAVKELFNTGEINLLNGVRRLLGDLVHNGGMPNQMNRTAFEIGHNLTTTQGVAVFRNEVLGLVQYKLLDERQHAKPLLIVSPQANKHCIFDLSPGKNFVQYALKDSLQIFVVSWRSPDAQHREQGLSTYAETLDQTIEVNRETTSNHSVNLADAYTGGLTATALLSHLQVRRQLRKVSNITYLVNLLDSRMESPAMLFTDEQTLEGNKHHPYQHGVLGGHGMAKVFAWTRPNDLIWNCWVDNYLLGRQPPVFDVLHWNNDNTRLPAAFYGELLDLFKHNPLTRPGVPEVSGTAVDLGKVAINSFHVAGITDHVTPQNAVYCSVFLLGSQRRFILSNNGYTQSIFNPPGNPKACYFENDKLSSDPRAWYYDAEHEEGSQWPVWLDWLQEHSGELGSPDFNLGSTAHPPLEAAPGTYVHVR